MKNKKIILIIGIIVLAIIIAVILFNATNKTYRGELSNKNKQIIAENAYINWALGFQYYGQALFNDGTIYKWDFSGGNFDYNVKSTEEHKNWILEHGTKTNIKVPEKDLNTIDEYIKKLDESIDKKNTANDAGSNYISIWKDDRKIDLKESGDFTGENNSKYGQKLISIINKYLK